MSTSAKFGGCTVDLGFKRENPMTITHEKARDMAILWIALDKDQLTSLQSKAEYAAGRLCDVFSESKLDREAIIADVLERCA